eukprot:4822832-Alexandrium_andersonii.AAC.1
MSALPGRPWKSSVRPGGPLPRLAPSDARPGPQQRPSFNDDPYGDIEVGFFKPSPNSKRTL